MSTTSLSLHSIVNNVILIFSIIKSLISIVGIMANRTMKYARTVKGTNPQYLVEKIIRTRVYDSRYWKEECFALNGRYKHFLLYAHH